MNHYTASYFLACQHKLITYHYELFLMKNLRRKWIRKLDILHEVLKEFEHAKSYVHVEPSPLGDTMLIYSSGCLSPRGWGSCKEKR